MFKRTLYLTILIAFGSIAQPQACWAKEYVVAQPQDFSIESEVLREVVSEYADGNVHVLQRFDAFVENLMVIYESGEGFIHRDIMRIFEAVEFAVKKHQGQYRINEVGAPYIIHPIGVADDAMSIGGVRDPDVIIAALLHDTVEDTDTSFEEVKSAFGSRVCGFVAEVTDDKTLPKAERKQLQIEHASHSTAGAAQIKLADKLYNLTDLYNDPITGWPSERIDAYFVWGWDVVDNLPWVNAKLKRAVKLIVDRHWQREGRKDKQQSDQEGDIVYIPCEIAELKIVVDSDYWEGSIIYFLITLDNDTIWKVEKAAEERFIIEVGAIAYFGEYINESKSCLQLRNDRGEVSLFNSCCKR